MEKNEGLAFAADLVVGAYSVGVNVFTDTRLFDICHAGLHTQLMLVSTLKWAGRISMGHLPHLQLFDVEATVHCRRAGGAGARQRQDRGGGGDAVVCG